MELGLSAEMEISGRAFTVLYYIGPGGFWWSSVMNSALPPKRLRPDNQPENQHPVSHMAQKKREKKGERKKNIQYNKI